MKLYSRDEDPAFHLVLMIAEDAASGRYTYPEKLSPDASVVELWGHELAKAVVSGDGHFLKRLAKWSEYLRQEGRVDDLSGLGDPAKFLHAPDERTLDEHGRDAFLFLCRVAKMNPPTKCEWKETTWRSYTRKWVGSVHSAVEDHRRELDRAARKLGLKFAPQSVSRTSDKRSVS